MLDDPFNGCLAGVVLRERRARFQHLNGIDVSGFFY